MNIEAVTMALALCGGLGLFLLGMSMVSRGLETAAGSRLKGMLEKLTSNRWLGLLVGVGFTMVVQSSSATTVMVVGFLNASLMSLGQAAGVILGANIGTTITAQIIAFKISRYAPVILLSGVALMMFAKKRRAQSVAEAIIGFGLLFVGLDMMSEAMEPLRSSEAFISILTSFRAPLVGIAVGALFTAVIQSSSASIGILQVVASQGVIDLEGSIYIIMGMNIGTCITAAIASLGANRAGKLAALMHFTFKLYGTVLFVLLLQFLPIGSWVENLSPGDIMRQIANMHTLFNVVTVVAVWPLVTPIVRFMERRLVAGKKDERDLAEFAFIDRHMLATPSVAVSQAVKEVERMGGLAAANLDAAMRCFMDGAEDKSGVIAKTEDAIDLLSWRLTEFFITLSRAELSEGDSARVGVLFHIVNDFERIGDHAENISEYARRRREAGMEIPAESMDELSEMYQTLKELLQLMLRSFAEHDRRLYFRAATIEEIIDSTDERLRARFVDRMAGGTVDAATGVLVGELVSNLERVGDHAINVTSFMAGGKRADEKEKGRG